MIQVFQLARTLRQVRNLILAIMNIAQARSLTSEQYQARFEAVGMLEEEAHDTLQNEISMFRHANNQ